MKAARQGRGGDLEGPPLALHRRPAHGGRAAGPRGLGAAVALERQAALAGLGQGSRFGGVEPGAVGPGDGSVPAVIQAGPGWASSRAANWLSTARPSCDVPTRQRRSQATAPEVRPSTSSRAVGVSTWKAQASPRSNRPCSRRARSASPISAATTAAGSGAAPSARAQAAKVSSPRDQPRIAGLDRQHRHAEGVGPGLLPVDPGAEGGEVGVDLPRRGLGAPALGQRPQRPARRHGQGRSAGDRQEFRDGPSAPHGRGGGPGFRISPDHRPRGPACESRGSAAARALYRSAGPRHVRELSRRRQRRGRAERAGRPRRARAGRPATSPARR